jgi:hypothetical protein
MENKMHSMNNRYYYGFYYYFTVTDSKVDVLCNNKS